MTGALQLIRLILRRDRVILPLWVILVGVVPAGYVSTFNALFKTDQERVSYIHESATNTGFVALYGPLHGTSLGDLIAWRSGFIPVIIAICAALTVVRHTRADEEAGRTELIGSAVIGRQAQLAAALIVTGAASVLLGLVLFGALAGSGLPAGGSLVMGVEFALSGWIFAGVAAVAAQLAGSGRGARSIAIGAVALAYALRVAGDASGLSGGPLSWLSWLSPLGWMTHIFPYGKAALLPVILALLFTAVVVVLAVILLGRRDLGAGLVPARLGRPAAAPSLRSPIALAWRLHRGLLLIWTAGFALLGLLFGGVGGSVLDIARDSSAFSSILNDLSGTKVLVDSYFASIATIIGLISACYAVQATLRMRDEEQSGHVEAVLSTSVGRYSWAASHLVFALLGPAVALFAEGLCAGLVYRRGELGPVIGSSLVQLPAVWVVAAVTVLVFGVLPRWSAASWAAPALCLLILLVGQTLKLNHWLLDISPFTHVPHVPGGDVAATPLVTLIVVAALVTAAGLTALRRRDIPS